MYNKVIDELQAQIAIEITICNLKTQVLDMAVAVVDAMRLGDPTDLLIAEMRELQETIYRLQEHR